MPDPGSPTVRGRRLAAELRRLRERTGLTGDEVAERLGWSASKISRIELHRTGVKERDLRHLLDLYQVAQSHRDELLALARESAQKGWLEVVAADFPVQDSEYLFAEAEAQSAWDWEPQVVPGLLQTEEYARAVMQGSESIFRAPPGETERRIRTRLMRQELLTKDPPLKLSVVIDESVLHRKFGDRSVMFRQLQRLVEVSELLSVEIRLLPLGGYHPVATGAFLYFTFAPVHEVAMPAKVTVEHLVGNVYLEDEASTHKVRLTFERLIQESLDPASTRDFIARASQELWS